MNEFKNILINRKFLAIVFGQKICEAFTRKVLSEKMFLDNYIWNSKSFIRCDFSLSIFFIVFQYFLIQIEKQMFFTIPLERKKAFCYRNGITCRRRSFFQTNYAKNKNFTYKLRIKTCLLANPYQIFFQ